MIAEDVRSSIEEVCKDRGLKDEDIGRILSIFESYLKVRSSQMLKDDLSAFLESMEIPQ